VLGICDFRNKTPMQSYLSLIRPIEDSRPPGREKDQVFQDKINKFAIADINCYLRHH
jgi:hypothetical protein